MARTDTLHGDPSGRLGSLIFYKRRDSDKTCIRTRPNMRLYARKHDPRFERTRQQNTEFKACVKAASLIAAATYPIKSLADFNYFGELVKVCKCIQQTDLVRLKGTRAMVFSQSHKILDGFSFSRRIRFESLVCSPIEISTDRARGTVQVIIPSLVHNINMLNLGSHPHYRFVLSLGWLPDLYLAPKGGEYEAVGNDDASYKVFFSSWYDWKKGSFPGLGLDIEIPFWNDLPHLTLIAAIGIEFGKPGLGGQIESAKYTGAGKICCTF